METHQTIVQCQLKQFKTAFKRRHIWTSRHPPSPAIGIKQRVTTARVFEAGTSVFTSVDTSPVQERLDTDPKRPEKSLKKFIQLGKLSQHADKYFISYIAMRRPPVCIKVRICPLQMISRTSSPDPDKTGKAFTTPGCTAGSPEDCTLKQKDIALEDVRCAHRSSCMEHIVHKHN